MIRAFSKKGRPVLDRSVQMSTWASPDIRDTAKELSKRAEVYISDLFEVWVTRAKQDEAFQRQSFDEARALHSANLLPRQTTQRRPPRPAKLLTAKEAAALLRCSVSTIYAEIKRGHLLSLRVGRGLRVLHSSLPSPTREGANG